MSSWWAAPLAVGAASAVAVAVAARVLWLEKQAAERSAELLRSLRPALAEWRRRETRELRAQQGQRPH